MQQNRFLVNFSVKFLANFLTNFLIVAIALGIFFRFYALDHKLYWHDEVYTSIRATGFTGYEIDRHIFQSKLIPATDLQKYQQIKPHSSALDTIRSLQKEDPQHPPLYFLMARGWMQMFGSSIAASRFLPALLSLLALPLIYLLSRELWGSTMVGLMAMALLALSPFDILFAQTARQYGLLTVGTIGSGWALLRALRLQTRSAWAIYTGSAAIGLYTHPFFGLSLIGHGTLVILRLYRDYGSGQSVWRFAWQEIKGFTLALIAAVIIYIPWLLVLAGNYQTAANSTSWAYAPVNLWNFAKLWLLSFTCLFFYLDWGFDNIYTYLARFPIALLIIISIYTIWQQRQHSQSEYNNALFILTSILVPFLTLAIPDLVFATLRSAVTRYLIPCFPAVQLAVAFFMTRSLRQLPLLRLSPYKLGLAKLGLAVLLTGSIFSCIVSSFSHTWWHQVPSNFNAQISDRVNSFKHPILVSDRGDDFTNMGDLIGCISVMQ